MISSRRARQSARGRRCGAIRDRRPPRPAHDRPADHDLARSPSTRSSTPGSGQPNVAICEHASVIPYVGRDRHPGRRSARSSSAGAIGPPPRSAQRSVGGCSSPASSSRASIVGTSETSVIRRAGSISASSTALGLETAVQDRGRGVDRAPDRDRQPADVGQRHRAQPPLGGVEPERHRRAERAGQEVARDVRTTGLGAEVVPEVCMTATSAIRSARPRSATSAPVRASGSCDDDLRARESLRPLAALSRRSIGTAAAPASRQRVQRDHELLARRQRDAPRGPRLRAQPLQRAGRRDRLAAARRRSGSAPGPRSRRDRGAWRRPGGARSTRPNGSLARRANAVENRPPTTRTSATRLATGAGLRDRQDHDRPARGPQRVPPETVVELIDAFTRAREDLEVGVVILTGEGPDAFCSGGDQRVRGSRGGYVTGADPAAAGRNTRRSAASTSPTCTSRSAGMPKPVVAMVAGYAVGGGHVLHVVCDLTIAADNARFGQTGPRGRLVRRRLRRHRALPPGRTQEGQGDLVPVPPVRRAGGARRWG